VFWFCAILANLYTEASSSIGKLAQIGMENIFEQNQIEIEAIKWFNT
jgi:hypothetical protein